MTPQTMFNYISISILPAIILIVLTIGLIKKVSIYETFIDGAKEGFKVSVGIIPYLVALIVAISMLRASGFIEGMETLIGGALAHFKIPVDILPIMIVRSLSGSAALGIFADIANHCSVDSYTLKLAAIMIGSSETTFYVLAVYFGSVGIKKIRYALLVGLIADIIGIIAAIGICNLFWS